jgi:hypothetical protein
MLVSQRSNHRFIGCQLGGVGFSGQDRGAHDVTALAFHVPNQICKGSALANKIIHNDVMPPATHIPDKMSLIREPLETTRAGMPYRIGLHDGTDD